MTCSTCGTINPEGAGFCTKCGSKLAVACANCSNPLPDGAVFCPICGHKNEPAVQEAAPESPEDRMLRFIPAALVEKLEAAARSGGALQGERRRVTMLFCDVQGSSTAAQQLDPEEWADIMNGAFEHLITPVYQYEGTLARLMGDAILAFFGAPIAHEDDPERAIRAGLGILEGIQPYRESVREEWGIDFDVRVGINTGLVVVGAVGSDLRVEYTAMGDAVNVAARMEQTAPVGTVQIADDTKVEVERLFEFEDLGDVDVKGRTEPVRSWRVTGELDRPDTTRGIEGLRAPMIGRDAEFETLQGTLAQVRGGGGAVVSVMGEAGLGKSRLMAEFKEAVEASHEPPPWFEGRSLSYETTTAYAPVRGILRQMVGIDAHASGSQVWPAVENLLNQAAPGRVAELAPFLTSLLGGEVPDEHSHRIAYLEPAAQQAAMFSAMSDLTAAMATTKPVVVVFDDLHWADSASLEMAGQLARVAETSQLLLVLVYRPRRSEGSWQVRERVERDHPHLHRSIDLAPLPDAESRALISELLAIDGLPEDVRALVLDHSDGNPYFLEEVVRSMIDAGVVAHVDGQWVAVGDVTTVAIPNTLAGLLTTRLDALDEACRGVVQAGSVLGREFRYDEVAALARDAAVLDSSLIELQRRDLVRETSRAPRRVYRFKHALVQQTAYEGLLRKERVQLHAAAAAFLSRNQPDRVEEIADHYLAANRPDLALPSLVTAGERALKAYLIPEAVARFSAALDAFDETPDTALLRRALEGLGKAREATFELEPAAEMYQRMVDDGVRLDDPAMRVSGTNKLALLKGFFFDQRGEALEELARAEQLATDEADAEGLVEACIAQCYLRTGQAEFDQVEYYMNKVARLGEEMGLTEPTLFGMAHFANTLVYTTRFDEALVEGEKTLAKAEETGNLKYQAEMLTFVIPTCHLRNGDVGSALASIERGMEIALQIGDRVSEALAAIVQGRIAMHQGAFDEALSSNRRAMAAGEATGVPYVTAMGMCTTATCYRRIGGPLLEKALELHSQTSALMEMPTGTTLGAWMWTEIGHCSLQAGDADAAELLFRKALDEMTAPMWLYRPSALLGLCETELLRGDVDAARGHYEEAKTYVTERKMLDYYLEIEMMGARLATLDGDHAAALRALDRSERITRNAGLNRILLDVLALRAEVHEERRDADQAATVRAQAAEVAASIAAGLRNDEVRSAFEIEARSLIG